MTNKHGKVATYVLEILVLELKLSKTNWLVIGTYKPPSINDIVFTSKLVTF